MEKLTEQEYKKLRPIEPHLISAFVGNWKRNTLMSEDSIVLEVMKAHAPGYIHNPGCPNCILQLYTRVGEWYVDYQNNLKPKEEKNDGMSTEKPGRKTRVASGKTRNGKKLS